MAATSAQPQAKTPGTTPLGTTNLGPFLREPSSIDETGLDLSTIADLVLKVIYFNSMTTGQTVADVLCLPFFNIVDRALTLLAYARAW